MADAFDGPVRGQRGRSIERSAKGYGSECFNHPFISITLPFNPSFPPPISRLIISFDRDCADFYDNRDLSYERENTKDPICMSYTEGEGNGCFIYDLFHVQCYYTYIYTCAEGRNMIIRGIYVIEMEWLL